jgi:hypothetical protein
VRKAVPLAGVIVVSVLVDAAASPATKPPAFVVRGPTIVAFFPPVRHEDLNDSDTNEELSDFQVYAGRAQEPLRKAGIEFHVVYSRSFRIRVGTKSTIFRPGKIELGYYFVAPGKTPRVEYGVLSDGDILEIAKEYFAN